MADSTVLMAAQVAVGIAYVKLNLMKKKKVEVILFPDPTNTDLIFFSPDNEGAAATKFRVTGTGLVLVMDGTKADPYLIADAAAQNCYVIIKDFIG